MPLLDGGLPTPPLLNGTLYHFLRVMPQLFYLPTQYLNVPPRARRVMARLIWVSFVLIFKVEAEPVHPFEEFNTVGTTHGLLAPYADRKLCDHKVLFSPSLLRELEAI